MIEYPFKWKAGTDDSFDADVQIDISHVVLANGRELQSGWREISAGDLSADDFSTVQRRIESLEMAIAKGEELPTTDEALARMSKLLDQTRWTIDMDSGRVVDKGWNGTGEPEVGTEYRSLAADFEGIVRVSSVSGDRVYYDAMRRVLRPFRNSSRRTRRNRLRRNTPKSWRMLRLAGRACGCSGAGARGKPHISDETTPCANIMPRSIMSISSEFSME